MCVFQQSSSVKSGEERGPGLSVGILSPQDDVMSWLVSHRNVCCPCPQNSECDLFGRQSHFRWEWLRWGHAGVGWAVIQYGWATQGDVCVQLTHGRTSYDRPGWEWCGWALQTAAAGTGRKVLLGVSDGPQSWDPLISHFWPPALWDNTLCGFKVPGLEYFVPAALGTSYRRYQTLDVKAITQGCVDRRNSSQKNQQKIQVSTSELTGETGTGRVQTHQASITEHWQFLSGEGEAEDTGGNKASRTEWGWWIFVTCLKA